MKQKAALYLINKKYMRLCVLLFFPFVIIPFSHEILFDLLPSKKQFIKTAGFVTFSMFAYAFAKDLQKQNKEEREEKNNDNCSTPTIGQTSSIANRFIKPSLDRPYHQICWLSSHNAYATKKDYPLYYNQSLTLQEQLAYGVRAFELDTYYHHKSLRVKIGLDQSTVCICHGNCYTVNRFIYKPHKQLIKVHALNFAQDILPIFKEFLDKNPEEIITFTLENYVDFKHGAPHNVLDEQFELAKIADYILKPTDWDPIQKKGWPTLQWLIDNNKRLIIFNDKSSVSHNYKTNLDFQSTKYTYYQWACMAQNQWGGAKNMNKALKERVHSMQHHDKPRYLFELDWFPDGATPVNPLFGKVIHTIGRMLGKEELIPFVGNFNIVNGSCLNQFLCKAREKGLSQPLLKNDGFAKQRVPNFIKIDEVAKGRAIDFVNAINKEADDEQKRNEMFYSFA